MTQEQSVLSKIVTLFAAEKIILQHNVLGYRIDAYFSKHKLAIEVDEQGHSGRDIDNEIRTFLLRLVKYRIILLCQ